MEVGEYQVWLMDDAGRVSERLFSRVTRTRAPAIGEGMFRDGECYRVRDIWHFDEKSKRNLPKKYSYPVVLVQRTAEPAPTAPSEGEDSLPSIGRRFPRRASAAGVLSLVPPSRASVDGEVPRELRALVAIIVACGYRTQADQLNAAAQLAWELRWDGRTWLLERLGSDAATAEELRALSRLAVQQYRAAASLALSLAQPHSGSQDASAAA